MLTAELATRLTAQSLTTGYTVTRGQLPSTPDKVIAIYETPGAGPSRDFSGNVVENPNALIVVRGVAQDYDAPRLTIEAIYQAVQNWGAFTVSSVRYLSITPLANPFVKNRSDADQRVEWGLNLTIEKELSPTA